MWVTAALYLITLLWDKSENHGEMVILYLCDLSYIAQYKITETISAINKTNRNRDTSERQVPSLLCICLVKKKKVPENKALLPSCPHSWPGMKSSSTDRPGSPSSVSCSSSPTASPLATLVNKTEEWFFSICIGRGRKKNRVGHLYSLKFTFCSQSSSQILGNLGRSLFSCVSVWHIFFTCLWIYPRVWW